MLKLTDWKVATECEIHDTSKSFELEPQSLHSAQLVSDLYIVQTCDGIPQR